MTTKNKLLNKISELEYKQERMEKKIEFLFCKDDGKAALSIGQDVVWWRSAVRVYYKHYGEVKCAVIIDLFENAKIVCEDKNSIVVCLMNSKGGKKYTLINKSTGKTVDAPADFSLEKEEKEGEKADD